MYLYNQKFGAPSPNYSVGELNSRFWIASLSLFRKFAQDGYYTLFGVFCQGFQMSIVSTFFTDLHPNLLSHICQNCQKSLLSPQPTS